jgi:hypothetical protein
MTNAFQILSGFLDRYDNEVEGRELQEPGPDIQIKLHQFARGTLPQGEQSDLLGLLNRNPQWIGRLAADVKGMRPTATKE